VEGTLFIVERLDVCVFVVVEEKMDATEANMSARVEQ
jgi:hypothetical protein